MKNLVKTYFRKIISLTLQCLWFLAIALPILMYLERPPVSSYKVREITNPIKPGETLPSVAPGETLHMRFQATINKECPGTVIRTILDSSGRPFNFVEEPRPELEAYPIDLIVPLGTFPGPAQYFARVRWRCNWVQEWFPKEVRQPPLDFIVEPAPGQVLIPEQQGIYVMPRSLDTTEVVQTNTSEAD